MRKNVEYTTELNLFSQNNDSGTCRSIGMATQLYYIRIVFKSFCRLCGALCTNVASLLSIIFSKYFMIILFFNFALRGIRIKKHIFNKSDYCFAGILNMINSSVKFHEIEVLIKIRYRRKCNL